MRDRSLGEAGGHPVGDKGIDNFGASGVWLEFLKLLVPDDVHWFSQVGTAWPDGKFRVADITGSYRLGSAL